MILLITVSFRLGIGRSALQNGEKLVGFDIELDWLFAVEQLVLKLSEREIGRL